MSKDMHKLLEEWREVLGLNDWDIEFSPEDPDTGGCGLTEWTEAIKSAHIHILPESCYGERMIPFDREKTLVHELLHLKFSVLTKDLSSSLDSNTHDRLLHQTIDELAKSFVKVKRENEKSKH